MKIYLLSLGAGLLVGVVYSLLQVRSPAPPLVALIGLLGILVGEQIVPVGKQLLNGTAFVAALVNVVFGVITAWMLTRYDFPGRRLIDAMVDLPFALPTAVAGIALTALYAPQGWIGSLFMPFRIAFTPLGIFVALIFIGLPFVVRTVQPVLEDTEKELEEAAWVFGCTRVQAFFKIVAPLALAGRVSAQNVSIQIRIVDRPRHGQATFRLTNRLGEAVSFESWDGGGVHNGLQQRVGGAWTDAGRRRARRDGRRAGPGRRLRPLRRRRPRRVGALGRDRLPPPGAPAPDRPNPPGWRARGGRRLPVRVPARRRCRATTR